MVYLKGLRARQADDGSEIPLSVRENPGKHLTKGLTLATLRAAEIICRTEHRHGVMLREYLVLVPRQIFKVQGRGGI